MNSQSNPQAPASVDTDLAPIRAQIDAVDTQLITLLNERAKLAQAVGHVKQKHNQPVFRPEREAQVLEKIAQRNPGPLPSHHLQALWREVMSVCRAMEEAVKVAFLGPAGTYTEQAMVKQFGHAIHAVDCSTIDDIFRAVEADGAAFGVVPIENSIEGAVNRTMDLLLSTPLTICGEVSLAINHHLLHASGDMSGVTTIVAHPQALAQCHHWLKEHHPQIEQKPVSSNAQGALMAQSDPSIAAIASEVAATTYGLQTVSAGIQDDANNRTRFIVIGKQLCGTSPNDKTSIILATPNKAGAVYALLEPFARQGVSMLRFESRPARQKGWEYFFYIDFAGHIDEPHVRDALAEIEASAAFYKCLGSYPVTL
ncbi:MAG: prephenate dehydratase [Formosimonas sp.]